MDGQQGFLFRKINSRLAIVIIIILATFVSGAGYWLSKSISTPSISTPKLKKVGALPPEKQAIADRYARERAAGLRNPAPRNQFSISTSTIIALGEQFTLKKGEVARIKNTDYFLHLEEEFEDRSRMSYRFTSVDGVPYLSDEIPYDVSVKDTDYKTYAILVVNSAETACATKIGIILDQCWDTLARRLSDETYCSRIKGQSIKDSCFEYLAATADNPAQSCQKVVSPKAYCQLFSLSYWKTFHSIVYGLSFQYPPGLFSIKLNSDGSISSLLLEDSQYLSGIAIQILPLDTEFHVAGDSNRSHYNQNTNEWIRGTYDENQNNYIYKPSCEKVDQLGTQHIPSYSVAQKYSEKFAVISKQGLIIISEVPVEQPIPPKARAAFNAMVSSITFDHPELIIKAKCN